MTTATLSLKLKSVDFPELNWKVICLTGFFVSLALLIFYVFQINYLTRGYYLVNTYEKQISQLTQENGNLQISFAENSFLGQVSQKAQDLNFQKTAFGSIKYIQIPESSVALNK